MKKWNVDVMLPTIEAETEEEAYEKANAFIACGRFDLEAHGAEIDIKETETTSDEKQFWELELDERNKDDLNKWVKNDEFVGLVDETKGGIIGYIHRRHSQMVINALNTFAEEHGAVV